MNLIPEEEGHAKGCRLASMELSPDTRIRGYHSAESSNSVVYWGFSRSFENET